MQTIRFRFLPLTMLGYIVVNAISCRDFGPMLDAEKAAASAPSTSASPGDTDEVAPEMSGPLAPDPGIKRRAKNALIPFGAVMGTAFAGMVAQGVGAIRALPLAGRPAVTLVNCLRYADSVRLPQPIGGQLGAHLRRAVPIGDCSEITETAGDCSGDDAISRSERAA